MDMVQVALFGFSICFSVVLVLYVQWVKKPKLETKISEYSFHNQDTMKIAHVKVRNKPIKFLSRWMNRDLATNCYATIRVSDASNGEFVKEFSGLKWVTNPEPIKVQPINERSHLQYLDSEIMMTASLKNIGERWENLDVALKHENDREFCITVLKNYPLNEKRPETRVDRRSCWVDLVMGFDNGKSKEKRYYLRNDSERTIDFELSEKPFG